MDEVIRAGSWSVAVLRRYFVLVCSIGCGTCPVVDPVESGEGETCPFVDPEDTGGEGRQRTKRNESFGFLVLISIGKGFKPFLEDGEIVL